MAAHARRRGQSLRWNHDRHRQLPLSADDGAYVRGRVPAGRRRAPIRPISPKPVTRSFRGRSVCCCCARSSTRILLPPDRVAWFCLTPEMYARSGAIPDRNEGLIEYLQSVKTVEVRLPARIAARRPDPRQQRSRGKVDVSRFAGNSAAADIGWRRLRTKLDPVALEKKKLLDLIAKTIAPLIKPVTENNYGRQTEFSFEQCAPRTTCDTCATAFTFKKVFGQFAERSDSAWPRVC